MADRMPPYPMFSQNIIQNSVQQPTQPQMPQQPQQPQQPDPQMLQGLSNNDVRMWQQMQSQMQNSYRAQQSADLAAAQLSQQEYSRGQAFPQGQQPIVQQLQQTFGLQRVNGASFHDPQGNQPQSHIPPGFAVNTPQMKSLPNRSTMQAAMSNPNLVRQFQMMTPQNPANQQALNAMDLARLQQQATLNAQHAVKQPGGGDMFAMPSNPDQMRGSPHPAAQQMGPPAGGQGPVQNGQRRIVTIAERRQNLQGIIAQLEQDLTQLQARPGGLADSATQQQIVMLRTGLSVRKDQLNKLNAAVAHFANSQQLQNGMLPPNMSHLSSVGASSSQPHPPVSGSTPPTQPGFVAQTPSHVFGANPSGNGPLQNNTHTSAAANQLSMQSGQMRQNGLPNRPQPAPHQLPGQVTSAMSPNMGNGNQFAMQSANGQLTGNQGRQTLMPLEKARFESTYLQYCRSQRSSPNTHVQIAENRMVDLYELHVQVMREGGHMSVTQRDLWAVIAGRMGFVQFPGSGSEPTRSGPGIASQVQHTYMEHLRQFESAYVMTMLNRGANNQQHVLPPGGSGGGGGGGPKPSTPAQPTEMQNNAPRVNSYMPFLSQFAYVSVTDMRAKGLPENMIAFVESHRTEITRWRQQTEMMRRAANEQQPGMPSGQGPLSSMQEQVSVGGPPGVQRPPQPMMSNTVPSLPTGEQRVASGQFAHGVPQPNPVRFPTSEELQQATNAITNWKNMCANRLVSMQSQHVPDESRLDYNQLLEQVHKLACDLDNKLATYLAVLRNEEPVRKCVAIVLTVARQRQLLSTASPQYVVSLGTLQNMFVQIQKVNEEFEQRCRMIKMQANIPSGSVNRQTPAPHPTPVVQPNITQPTPLPTINRQVAHSLPPPPPPQPAQQHPQPPPKKPTQSSVPPSPSNPPAPIAIASPTPPPAASTPAVSVATPQTAGSPQTPKSPKTKVAARPKVQPRIKKSSSAKGPATPEATPAPVAGVKRPPEDDPVAPSAAATPSDAMATVPSPKKVKTEWEGEPSEALAKRQQELESIKTEEDATTFLNNMIALASRDESVRSDFAASVGLILAGIAQDPADAAGTAAAISAHISRDPGPPPTALSPHHGPANDAFFEFLDLSSYPTLDDEDSKPPTPELLSSSEANPSPESGSDADLTGGSPDKTKNEDSTDHISFLRLGALKEIDGGESAYYQMDNWRWAGEMPTLDQPWAMSTSS
ncbi:hypothetical protein V8B97DRAFT_1948787 [Scleroderma yunnanense]